MAECELAYIGIFYKLETYGMTYNALGNRRVSDMGIIGPTLLFPLFYLGVADVLETSYVFHFRRTEFIDSEALRSVVPGVEREVMALCRKMEVNCRFTRAMEEYEGLQMEAPTCATQEDKKILEEAISGFHVARGECVQSADCTSGLARAVEDTIIAVENIDVTADKSVTACGDDDMCKYNVYNNTHHEIASLYLGSQPQLRLLADREVASPRCAGAIVTCMVTRNEHALRSVYQGAERIRECMENNRKL